jgi:isocitrate dehydrogenase kinase/phosphatase
VIGNDTSLAERGADVILGAFDSLKREFESITRHAEWRFVNRDWTGVQEDAQRRLELYAAAIDGLVSAIETAFGARAREKSLWRSIKAVYSRRVQGRVELEIAETFFNSLTRRLFSTVGVDPEIEFVASDLTAPEPVDVSSVCRTFPYAGGEAGPERIRQLLRSYGFAAPYRDLEGDADLVAAALEAHLRESEGPPVPDRIEMLRPVFYRGRGAFLVGRVHCGATVHPFVLALLSSEEGLLVDALLSSPDEVSILFSFTRSYFHVEVERHREVVRFLRSIMPKKPVSELYISMGWNKHGKTLLYRELLHHLERSEDRFETARGDPGMVMIVFTLPSHDMVYKIIRDEFALPKSTTRRQVEERYRLVFTHDRVGRLVDAQVFEHLQFAASRFSPPLLEELLRDAGRTVSLDGDRVVISHLYAERRIRPLNLYLGETSPSSAADAILDYGQAIKDLAAANIFPGDFLLKNFGVTRHQRVVFYDYDELCLLTDCRFRRIPESRNDHDDLESEPWFPVADLDVFPEEFRRFLQLRGPLLDTFLAWHSDLFDDAFWREMQERHRSGDVPEIPPYRSERRLRGR